jgi:zinc and cadmium transporter
MVLAYILIFTFLGSIASLVGSFFLLIKRQLTQSFTDKIVNFAAGVLIAVALLDLLPAAQESAGAKNIFMPTLVGFVIFFFAERFLQWFHRHHEHGQRASVLLILVGDGVHNFIDGVAIAASFLTSIPLGITTSLAVAAHEIPQEIADMSVLLTSGLSKSRALFLNFLSALTALAGALLAFFFAAFIRDNIYIFLSATAGFFIYISASDLIPSLHEKYLENRKFSYSFLFLLGILVVVIFAEIFKG